MRSLLLHHLVILGVLSSASAYHILCVFPTPYKSHAYLGKGIVDALLDSGHKVTVVTPFPDMSPNKNLRQIEVSNARNLIKGLNVTSTMTITKIRQLSRGISLAALTTKEVKEAVVKEQYDAIISDWFFSDIEAGMDYSQTVSLYEQHFAPIAAARGVLLPLFANALHNVSIMFVNSHPSFAPAQSLPPNVVEIAGYHISEKIPPLPKDLQDLLDSSTGGVIYFSMGSVVKSSAFPESLKRELIEMFSELPYTVLWKFEEKLDDLPENIHVRPWMPQTSILAHRNVKLFITHGGLLSTLESIRFGMPVLIVPVYGDQPGNAARAVRAGHAQQVPISPDMTPQLKTTLNEMLSNDSYYKTAKALSKLFNNRPVSQRKLITHYVELAIESKGAYHLRSKSLLYAWYQLWMLDQIAALATALVLLYLLVKKIYKSITKRLFKVAKKKEKEI